MQGKNLFAVFTVNVLSQADLSSEQSAFQSAWAVIESLLQNGSVGSDPDLSDLICTVTFKRSEGKNYRTITLWWKECSYSGAQLQLEAKAFDWKKQPMKVRAN